MTHWCKFFTLEILSLGFEDTMDYKYKLDILRNKILRQFMHLIKIYMFLKPL